MFHYSTWSEKCRITKGENVITDEMKPGDVRTFKRGQGNAVVLATGVWAEKRGKLIHIRKLLIENQCWPFGDEGVETEHKD
jgi:uncharacterized cupin superfamily protein